MASCFMNEFGGWGRALRSAGGVSEHHLDVAVVARWKRLAGKGDSLAAELDQELTVVLGRDGTTGLPVKRGAVNTGGLEPPFGEADSVDLNR